LYFKEKRQKGRTFFYTAMISASLHALILSACFIFLANPFAGRKTIAPLPVIQASLVSWTDLEWTRSARPMANLRQTPAAVRKREKETPAGSTQPLPVPPPEVPTTPQNVTAFWDLTSRDDGPGKETSGQRPSADAIGSSGGGGRVAAKTTVASAGVAAGSGGAAAAPPRYHSTPRPVYPAFARARSQEGVVLVTTEVLADGHVGNVRIKKSSGYALLDQSALNAVKTWIFVPARKMNIAVSTHVDIPIRFSLSREE